MKLLSPILGSYTLTQKFGGNANTYYAENGLKGHPGTDLYKGYDAYIFASHDAYVYKVLNKNNPDLTRYRAVCTLYQDEGQWYELVYGHCNNIYVNVGDTVVMGSLVGSMGNTGDVYSQGLPVSASARTKPPYPGTHLHWQLRKVLLSKSYDPGKVYLGEIGAPYKDKEGNYYQIPEWTNGYNGCVDGESLLYKPGVVKQLVMIQRAFLNIKLKVVTNK